MERMRIPRVVIAGTGSGCGKTTVTCAILQALLNRKKTTGAFKCGPDYIDPMFHSRIIGAASSNLDAFFFSDNTLKYLLAENARGRDISIIEGVMGYYDGLGMDSVTASTFDIARITESPVILTVPAKGASLSLLAVIAGFLDLPLNLGGSGSPYRGPQKETGQIGFREGNSRICGVIFNQCSQAAYEVLSKAILNCFSGRVRPLGYLPPMQECSLESRHLGLVTAMEVKELKQKMQLLSQQAEKSIDLDGILDIAEQAPELTWEKVLLPQKPRKIRIAVARDNAFCFYYEDSLKALETMGAELVFFSPLSDSTLPRDIDGLYLGGGYPELYAGELSRNISMRNSVKTALTQQLPCIAECGGFMYLTEKIGTYPMVSFLPGTCYDTGKLRRFGYVTLTAALDNLLCPAGGKIRAHEFHYWDLDAPGDGFCAEKASGKHWPCVHTSPCLYAGFPHFHFYANPAFAVRFYEACMQYQQRRSHISS